MSSFLWVEDFEGEDKQCRQFANAIFGSALNLNANDFPQEINELRDFLASRQIVLANTYAEAARFINERLDDFDNIVLDIDLKLAGEDMYLDGLLVTPVLTRWYDYKAGEDNEEESYNSARDKMKAVAGYHLFIDLVLNRGFSRERILFCSNHGNHLDSINKSFNPAKIEAPDILGKLDKRIAEWVTSHRDEPYPKLRRWVILACRELLERKSKFIMPERLQSFPDDDRGLTQDDGESLLATLPLLLPTLYAENKKGVAFRSFIRALTQDWDKKIVFTKLESIEKASANMLVLARNWTSHNRNALSRLSEEDVALFFLIALRFSFDLDQNNLEKFESALLPMIGNETLLDSKHMDQMRIDYKNSYSSIKKRGDELTANNRAKIKRDGREVVDNNGQFQLSTFFNDMVNDLEKSGKLNPGEHEKLLRQVFWHCLHRQNNNAFAPQEKHFSKTKFMRHLTMHLYRPNFE